MISLKKHIESSSDEMRKIVVNCYLETLDAIGASAEQAVPPLGADFRRNLGALSASLNPAVTKNELTSKSVADTHTKTLRELGAWGDKAARYFKEKASEAKEIMLILARSAESLGERDQRYSTRFGAVTERLHQIAHLDDLSSVRRSLAESATELTACVNRMSEEGRESLAQLRSEVDKYRERCEVAEKRASVDALTGLANRETVDRALLEKIRKREIFCVVLLDLNEFKQINDSLGHAAGDDVLKNFGKELRRLFRPIDLVARWGGDEFLCVVDCRLVEALQYNDRLARDLFGAYEIDLAGKSRTVNLTAAVGIAEWDGSETLARLLARADASMYEDKGRRPRPGRTPPTPMPSALQLKPQPVTAAPARR